MLHVVHEVERQRVLRARVQRRKDTWNAIGRNDHCLLEARVECELPHIFGAFLMVDPHVGDGRKLDPRAQPLDRSIVIGKDRRSDLGPARIIRSCLRWKVRRGHCNRGQSRERRSICYCHPVPFSRLELSSRV